MKFLLLAIFISSCSTSENEKPNFDTAKAVSIQNDTILMLQETKSDSRGFLKELLHNGDSFLWQAKWCAISGCDMDEFESEETGRYCRDDDCDVHKSDDDGNGKFDSNTGWSGDMAVCGLAPWAIMQKRVSAIKDHVQYGEDNNWVMGPIAEGLDTIKQFDAETRVKYSPVLQKYLKNVRYYLTENNGEISQQTFFDTSKKDFEAHLQSCHIWGQALITGESSELMSKIVGIHHNRVPGSPFYAFLHGWLNGDWNAIKQICESTDIYLGDYIRCDGSDQCGYAEKVFSCELMIRASQGQLKLSGG